MPDPINPLPILNPPPEPQEENPAREDIPFITRRLTLLVVMFGLVVAIFSARIYQLTVLEGPKYRETSDHNFLLQEPLIAPRGRILDCKGRPLAINQSLFDIQMSRFKMTPRQIRSTLDRLAALLDRPQIRNKADQVIKHYKSWEPISLLDHKLVNLQTVLPVLEQSFDLPGVIPVAQYQRSYPAGVLAGSVTGHVGIYTESQRETFEALGYLPDEKIGQMGAERTFEKLLHGEHGMEVVFRDAQGRPHDRTLSRPCVPGAVLTLTIDLELQRLADQLLGTYHGVVVAMDPRDGSVLALASHPNYDPNDPSGRLSPKGTVSSFNKATRGVYAPGSTFKLVTAAAGLQANLSPKGDTADCDGVYVLPGTKQRFRCTGHHGGVDLYEGMQKSCNVFFLNWAYRLRGDFGQALIDEARTFGFGERTDFELVGPSQESPGIAGKPKAMLGNIVQMGIGQGELIGVTPIQVARAYASIANGGTLYRPRILKEAHLPDGTPIDLPEYGPKVQGKLTLTQKQRDDIMEGFRRVVNDPPGGTASRYGIKPEWHVYGKTGTAQIGGGKVNAWFSCFAPVENPSILLVILVENSPAHGGTMCAPLARQLLSYYFGTPEPQIWPAGTEPPKVAGEGDSTD